MNDDLDKLLDSYKVADADKALLDRIVATAQKQPANRNDSTLWLRRGVMLATAGALGFWLGNATIPVQQSATATRTAAATSTAAQEYLDNMILGPDSVTNMNLQ